MSNRRVRNVDQESGMSRTSNRFQSSKKRQPAHSAKTESDSEVSYSESEVEEFKNIRQKDDSRRPKGNKPPKDKRNQNIRPNIEPVEETTSDVEEVKKVELPTTASHSLFLLSAAYRTGLVSRGYPLESTYIPDVSNMFSAVYYIASTVSENSLLHERFPAYTSIGLYAYYAHVFFYHILRVREEAQLLNRIEKRCLRRYQQVGPLESWEIATPIIGFIQSFGRVIPEGGKYGQIVPTFPNLGALSGTDNNSALFNLTGVRSIARIPIMPAIHMMLHCYGARIAQFDDTDGLLYPTTNKKLSSTNNFLGIARSRSTDNDFQTLAFSSGWNTPLESANDTYMKIDEQKRTLIRRWNIPEIPSNSNLSNLENFLALEDDKSVSWIKQLLKLSNAVNKFYPGSVSLANIPPNTRIESVTLFNMKKRHGTRGALEDFWYHGRSEWLATFEGKILREDAAIAYQSAFSTGARLGYENSLIPTTILTPFADDVTGPYFDADTCPATEVDGTNQPDPVDQFSILIETKMYDNKGGLA